MKRFFSALGICLLVFITVKTIELDKKVSQIARPSKLFTPGCIISDFPHNAKWEVKISPSHDRFFYMVSQQPLYWLGKGMQVVVFETADQKYAVKFFQLAHLKDTSKRSWIRGIWATSAISVPGG